MPDLLEACSLRADETLILELDELVSADPVGIDALLRLERQGGRLVALPQFLRLALDSLARDERR